MKTVHFVRHGETEENNKGVWQGHSETALNKKGVEQAKLLAERFQKDNFEVFTSDLLRAKETAKFLSDTYESRENLREINVGDFAGKSVKETYSNNSEIFTALQDDSYSFPNGETVREFKNRVKSELDYIFDKTEENSTTIVITLITIFIAGPDVSLNGSPIVSPITAALCSSEPFPAPPPASIYFFALSQAPPELAIKIAKRKPVTSLSLIHI